MTDEGPPSGLPPGITKVTFASGSVHITRGREVAMMTGDGCDQTEGGVLRGVIEVDLVKCGNSESSVALAPSPLWELEAGFKKASP
jgi:hypothetical protein